MGKNDYSVTCRFSKRMLLIIDRICASEPESSRSDVLMNLLRAFMENPVYVSHLDVRELREPLEEPVAISISPDVYEFLKCTATEQKGSLSSVIRMSVYVELKRREELE